MTASGGHVGRLMAGGLNRSRGKEVQPLEVAGNESDFASTMKLIEVAGNLQLFDAKDMMSFSPNPLKKSWQRQWSQVLIKPVIESLRDLTTRRLGGTPAPDSHYQKRHTKHCYDH